MLAIDIFQIILIAYFGFASFYIFIFSFAGMFKLKNQKNLDSKERKFAVLIPGYKEDQVIIEVAEDALKQNYPKELSRKRAKH